MGGTITTPSRIFNTSPYILIFADDPKIIRNIVINILLTLNLSIGHIICPNQYDGMFNKYIAKELFYDAITTEYVNMVKSFKQRYYNKYGKFILTYQIWNNYKFSEESHNIYKPLLYNFRAYGITNIIICNDKTQYSLHRPFVTDIVFDEKYSIKRIESILNFLSIEHIKGTIIHSRRHLHTKYLAHVVNLLAIPLSNEYFSINKEYVHEISTKLQHREMVRRKLCLENLTNYNKIVEFNKYIKDELMEICQQNNIV